MMDDTATDWHYLPPFVRDSDGTVLGAEAEYHRASSIIDCLEDKGGLHAWQMNTLLSLVTRRPARRGDATAQRMVQEATREYADHGDRVHAALERAVAGGGPGPDDALAAPILEALERAGYVPVASEYRVMSDRHRAAGTADLALLHVETGLIRAGDLKTGALKPGAVCAQMAVYADHPLITDRDTGVVVWAHRDGRPVAVYEADLTFGRELIALASRVRDAQVLMGSRRHSLRLIRQGRAV